MSAARDRILARIRAANGRDGPPPADSGLRAWLERAEPHVLPARATAAGTALVDEFVSRAQAAGATLARVAGRRAVPAAIARFLAREGLGDAPAIAPDPLLAGMEWPDAPRAVFRRGRAAPSDAVGVTPAAAGIAETGTLLVHSGAARPNTLHFLPETHIAVVGAGDVVGAYEHAWRRLRAALPEADWPPRTVTLITGPSRTSDIEKTLQIGVHGPRRLHIVLIDGEETR